MPWEAPGSTAIVVLTPEAEPITGEWYRAHSKAGSEGMRPHITLLVPFVPAHLLDAEVDHHVREVLAGVESFNYALERVERWPGGILYLAPEPARPFVDLAHVLMRDFPDYLPYDGIHDEVIPHATVAVSDDKDLLSRIASAVEPQLPIRCRAAEAMIVERGSDLRWRRRSAISLGAVQ